jgi:hypothetical protein
MEDHLMVPLTQGGTWQPIETAPIEPFDQKRWFMAHSERLLLYRVGGWVTIGTYNFTEKGKGRWQHYLGNIEPTHWMPLPEPPSP